MSAPIPPSDSLGADELQRVIEACDRFEAAWNIGRPRRIEDDLQGMPATLRTRLFTELLALELELRRARGASPTPEEYFARFPEWTDALDVVFAQMLAGRLAARAGQPILSSPTLVNLGPTRTITSTDTSSLPDTPGPTDIWVGRRLGEYLLLERIGRGGMGLVFKARHMRLDRLVAVKVLPAERFAAAAAVARFGREMKAIGRLDHPNIVIARDAGEADGVPFLVMELLDGLDLASLVRDRGLLGVADACEVIRQAALGLRHAHEAGLVHRDFKPSNLFLTRAGTVKLLDLGLARVVEELGGEQLTPDAQAMGTFDYMAPEQWHAARDVDLRADLYSLACTLFALLAGGPPFGDRSHATLASKMEAHLHELPPPLRGRRPDAPPALADLVARLLAKDPAGRLPDAGAVAEAVAPFCAGNALALLFEEHRPPPAGPTSTAPPAGPDRDEDAGPDPARRPLVDEDVQFTVYRPRVVAPLRWATMLVFTHLASKPPGASPDSPDPAAEVARQAERVLGPGVDRSHHKTSQESMAAVPHDEVITLVPVVTGVEFNPPRRQFRWVESVHREEFGLRASPALDGQAARGRLSVFLGSLLLAEVALSIKVDSAHAPTNETPTEKVTASRIRRLFASYAREDRPIAKQFERFARALGDEYLSRCSVLRAGDCWDDRISQAIESADVFQLFWSRHALRSPIVEREWRYALSLGRLQFVRPVYWEEPLPTDPQRGLPPDELRRLYFQKLDGVGPLSPSPRRGSARRPSVEVAHDSESDSDFDLTPSSIEDAPARDDASDFELTAIEEREESAATPLDGTIDLDVTAARPDLSGINLSRPGDSGISLKMASELGRRGADSIEEAPLSGSNIMPVPAAPGKSKPSLRKTPPPARNPPEGKGKSEKNAFDDTDFEVDALDSDRDSDDRTMQLEAQSDFELEDADTGSEVFAIDEDVDQWVTSALGPAGTSIAKDDEDDATGQAGEMGGSGSDDEIEGGMGPSTSSPASDDEAPSGELRLRGMVNDTSARSTMTWLVLVFVFALLGCLIYLSFFLGRS